jgi:phage tail tape-measure protein
MTTANKGTDYKRGRGTDSNPDPITGAPGAHPVGTGVGAAAAGAAAGAAGGLVAGPVGAAVGAVIGGVAGGLAGKRVAESIDPTVEDAYWQENYAHRPYYDNKVSYELYQPAYRYGWESRAKYADRSFDEVEADLRNQWEASKHASKLKWDKAQHATRDAWNRIEHAGSRKHQKVAH